MNSNSSHGRRRFLQLCLQTSAISALGASTWASSNTALESNPNDQLKRGEELEKEISTKKLTLKSQVKKEIVVLSWKGYFSSQILQKFKEEYGIAVTVIYVNNNREIVDLLRESQNSNNVIDLIFVSNYTADIWRSVDFLQPLALNYIEKADIYSNMLNYAYQNWNFNKKNVYWLPYVWGCEGVLWRPEFVYLPNTPSYLDMFSFAGNGKASRFNSLMWSGLIYLSSNHLLKKSIDEIYIDRDDFEINGRQVLDYFIKEKKVSQKDYFFINNEKESLNVFKNQKVLMGLTDNSIAYHLFSRGYQSRFSIPEEGGMAWIDGMAIPKNSKNYAWIYTFINFLYQKEIIAFNTNFSNVLPVVQGVGEFEKKLKKTFKERTFINNAIYKLHFAPQFRSWQNDSLNNLFKAYQQS